MRTQLILAAGLAMALAGCNQVAKNSDNIQRKQQEEILERGTSVVGMPGIQNFAERKLLRDVYEMRDRLSPTYTYLFNSMNGQIGEKICDSLGFGIPYGTQFSNPEKVAWLGRDSTIANGHYGVMPQAEPNGLFSPSTAEGTWVFCKVPGEAKASPQYVEPRIIVLTYPRERLQGASK